MNRIVALNYENHQWVRVVESRQSLSVINQHLIPLVPKEIFQAAVHIPVLITKNENTGKFGFSALMGFERGENLFVKEGIWDISFEPMHMRRQPFFVGKDNEHEVVCIDIESELLSREQGAPLFNKDESPTEFLTIIEETLGQLMVGEQQSERVLEDLLSAKLIKPLTMECTFSNGESKSLNGAYTIDDDRLLDLDEKLALSLYRNGTLAIIHLLQVSLQNMPKLIERKEILNRNAQAWFE